MSRKRKPLPLLENVEILEATANGKSFAKVNDLAVFSTGTVPGDIVDLQVFKKRRRYLEAKVVKFHKYSDKRSEPFCEHFGTCGGCKWQFMGYEHQLEAKQKQVVDNLSRIGKLELPEINPILGSKKTTFYRNKMEYTFSNKRWLTIEEINSNEILERNALGFHIPNMFDKIVDINKCHLQTDETNTIRNAIRDFALKNKLSFFDLREQNGLLRNLIFRTTTTGELMVIVVFFENDKQNIANLLKFISTNFKPITSLLYIVNQKKNDSITDQEVILYQGKKFITEEMEGLEFKIGPKSFYQTNSQQAYELYKIIRNFANISSQDLVYDLYTGTGTIANFIAKKAKHVVGVEYVPEAIEDAKENSKNNNISNTSFFAGDMKDVLSTNFIKQNGTPSIIITDPPRAGMHTNVVEKILEIEAKKVIYVSCNPATQARDLELLSEKYKVVKVQAVDMFPHTHHVENVVLLIFKIKTISKK